VYSGRAWKEQSKQREAVKREISPPLLFLHSSSVLLLLLLLTKLAAWVQVLEIDRYYVGLSCFLIDMLN
jgi:hypothetical protein